MTVIYCPKSKCSGSVPVERCLYLCPKTTRIKCKAYEVKFLEIKEAGVDQKYVDKYGEPEYLLPVSMRKRRRKRKETE